MAQTRQSGFQWVGVLIAGASCLSTAAAAPIKVEQTYQFLDNVSPNVVGISAGTRQQFGSTCVVLIGNPCGPQNAVNAAGTAISALQGNVSVSLSYVASALNSNHWAYTGAPDVLPDGNWTLTATNGPNQAVAQTPALVNAVVLGFAQAGAIQQSGLSPTFSWALPAAGGASVNATTAVIRDVTDVRNGISSIIYRSNLPAGATAFTVLPGSAGFVPGFSLSLGRQYALEIQLQDTRDNTPNGAFSNVLSQSRTYLGFSLSANANPAPQYLPIIDISGGSPVYNFQGVPVQAGQTVLIDPEVAIGFDYQVAAGDPLFRSVTLPTGVGDGQFGLWLWNGSAWVDTGSQLQGGAEFLLPATGVDRFRITGIEPEAGPDPLTGGFTTGVSFLTSGSFNGTMTPLITTVVPEPATYALWALGLVALWGFGRRRAG